MSGATRKLLCFLEVLRCKRIRNTSQTSGQSSGTMEMESEDAEVTSSATAPIASPNFDLNLDALDVLRISGDIEVTYLAGWQKN